MTAPSRRSTVLAAVRVYRWEDASALQNVAPGTLLRPDWIAIVPAHLDRPRWIPRWAEHRPMKDGETAFFWQDDHREAAS